MSTLTLQDVLFEVKNRVATVTLNRPDALNAWTRNLATELHQVLDHAAHDDDIRAVVLTGAGRAFSSGADLKGADLVTDGKPDVLSLLREVYNPLIMRVRTIPKPVIAVVNGPAVGIGCSLALACDLIVAADSAYFLLAFANIGLTLDGGSSMLMTSRIGHARASEMGLLAGRIPASQALEWGLINRVVPGDELTAASDEIASKLAAGPPRAYARIKQALDSQAFSDLAEVLDREAMLQQELMESADFVEGVRAFIEKRPAEFTGA